MKPQSSKAKGRNFQNKIRDLILATFPELEADDVRSTSMGAPGEDVQLSPKARKAFPYQTECKSKARSQIHTYYVQAQSHGKHEPIVFVKQDRKETLAIVEAEHFLSLLKELHELRNK